MSIEPKTVAQRAVDALPEALRQQPIISEIAKRIADEVIRYGDGTLPFERRGDAGEGVVEMICEDLEATFLLSELLATEEEEAEELTPEQLVERVLTKAQQVKAKLEGGDSLQKLIRVELADTDCGACDHPTCDLYSIALADGSDGDNDKCEPGGPKVTAQVELVMSVGRGEEVDAEKILAIEAQAKDDTKREGGLRVLEIATGRGFPGVTFSQIFPDVQFEVIESDLRRTWFLKRLVNLLTLRNARIRVGTPADHVDKLAGQFDAVLIKHMNLNEAVRLAVPFLRPGGMLINWQDQDWSDMAADYQHEGHGMRMPLLKPYYFRSSPIADSVLLRAKRPEEAAPPEEPDTTPETEDTDDSVAV